MPVINTVKIDLSEINQYPNAIRKALKSAAIESLDSVLLHLLVKVKESLPDVYGRLIRATRKRIVSRGGIHSGEIYVAKRSGGAGRTTTDVYADYVEEGTGSYSSLPPIWPIRLWVVRKFSIRGKNAWKAAKGVQKKIAERGTEGQHVFKNVANSETSVVQTILDKKYTEVFSRIFKRGN